jgi:glycosyltransferase involved in cell wall biosynthesis
LKILHLIDSGGLYGAEKMLLSLVKEQVSQGLEPMILSAGEPGIENKALELACAEKGLPIVRWRMKPGLNLQEGAAILSWAKTEGFELVHSHGYKFNILMGLMPKKLRALKFVCTIHGYTANSVVSKLFLYEVLDSILSFRPDRVVVVNAKLKRQLLSKQNVSYIPNGIEVGATAAEEAGFGYFGERFIVSVGRLSKEKAVDKAITAFSLIADQYPDLNLVVVGDGPEKEDLTGLVQHLGLEKRVFFEGYKKSAEPYIKAAEILFISSATEGLPLTLLEAMYLKTAVVSTSVGEIPNVLENGQLGYLVEAQNAAKMAAGLKRALDNPGQTSDKVGLAYSKLHAEYTADKMAGRYLELYREVLSA